MQQIQADNGFIIISFISLRNCQPLPFSVKIDGQETRPVLQQHKNLPMVLPELLAGMLSSPREAFGGLLHWENVSLVRCSIVLDGMGPFDQIPGGCGPNKGEPTEDAKQNRMFYPTIWYRFGVRVAVSR